MPYLGNEPAVAYTSTTKDSFSGDGSTTDFTMSKSANVNAVRVVVENVVQNPTVAYTCSGTTISFTSAPPTGTSNIYVVHLGPPAATIAPPTTINNATTFTGGVTLKNETAEDTDGGRESIVTFQGTQSGNEITTLAQIQVSHDGTSDDEKGDLIFKVNDGSDGASPTEAMRIDSGQNLGLGTNSPDVRLHVTDSQEQLTLSEGGSKGATFDYRSSTGNLNIATNGADARANPQMTLDLNGKVGIGTAAPLRQLSIANSASAEMSFISGTSSNASILFGDGLTGTDVYRGYIQYEHANDAMTFATAVGERMRIDGSANILFGLTTANSFPTGNNFVQVNETSGVNITVGGHTGTHTVMQFRHNGATTVGSIVVDGSNTTYNTSSDYRLKENLTDISDGITRVKQLLPKRFNFIVDADKTVDGFLAHEAATVVPEAVTGTKDGLEVWTEKEEDELPDGVSVGDNKLDDDGNTIPKMQGIDQSKLVPLLTAALQEAIAKIETLETKVAALEAG